ncbi:MAG: VWA domain-containing protein [Spirochaetaceae bacterium]|nr:VWA domain-containing protein [Spirochaetaceae bacterium]
MARSPASGTRKTARTATVALALGSLVLVVLVALAASACAAPRPAAGPEPLSPPAPVSPSATTGGAKPAEGETAAAPKPADKDRLAADEKKAAELRGATREDAAKSAFDSGDASPPAPGMALGRGSGAAPAAGSAAAPRAAPSQSGLKAGFSDDNEQYGLFVKFLDQWKETPHKELDVRERLVLKLLDAKDRPVANADLVVKVGSRTVAKGKSYSDGGFSIYPRDYAGATEAQVYRVEVASPAGKAAIDLPRGGPRSATVKLAAERKIAAPLPVDVLFIMDTTGSMGEEIERLRATIEIIHTNLSALKPKPAIRFGLVLYKDREDEYVTEVHPFTADLDAFQKVLDGVTAGGGGDTPEDLQAALEDSVRRMAWNKDGLRLAFAVTDAPAQLYPDQTYDYAAAAREAKEKGIKLFTIGTGGLDLEGEYVLRQLSQYTQGKYIFLTYGEGGESEGGKEGSVSHHTGTNFTTDKLEAVVIRFVKEELARFSEKPLVYDESFYEANKIADESREDTLGKLFAEALQNLADYSTFRMGPETRLAVMPIAPPEAADPAAPATGLSANAEYFGSQLAQAATAAKLWTIVERKDLQKILKELELQLSGLADEESAAKVGKLLGAEVLVSGSVYRKDDRYELFLKLVRVETAEVLAATKARIDAKLGL